MARGPFRISQGAQMLPLLPLLLLFFRDAGGSHKTLAQTPLSAAIDGLAADKDPQRSHGDAAAAISLEPGDQDMVAVHMLRLYEKYSRRGARPGGGNTVRSFRARLDRPPLQPCHHPEHC